MKRAFLFLVSILLCTAASSSAQQQAMHFPQGFSIAPLGGDCQTNYMILSMSLPPADGFSPNVNVITQKFQGTADDYLAVTRNQFDQMKMTLIRADEPDKTTLVLEYTGAIGDRQLHFYAKAFVKTDHVILVTATVADSQWQSLSAPLQACVDSLQMDK